MVALQLIHAQAYDLHVAAIEFGLDPRQVAELRGADGCEVLRVREQD